MTCMFDQNNSDIVRKNQMLVTIIAIPGTFLDGLLGVVLLVVAQPPQPAPFLGIVLQVGAQRPQPRWL